MTPAAPAPPKGAAWQAPLVETALTRHAGVRLPIICGAMYPCSNPELVGAVSAAGAVGVLQPVSLTYVYGLDFRDGVKRIRALTDRPIGMNLLIEQSSHAYHEKMVSWLEIALEEGVRFFITSLGKPRWVVDRVHSVGGIVYHNVTNRRWAEKAVEAGVHGLIGVNNRAGGHAGELGAERLLHEVADLGLPVVCAGGIGDEHAFVDAMDMGYVGVQMGTRFIATTECAASDAYKQAIVQADEADIVLSERITGVPLAVIKTPFIERMGTRAGPLARWMLRGRRTKRWMRTIYALKSAYQLKKASLDETGTKDYWQAGKSAAGIHAVEPAAAIIQRFSAALGAPR